MEFHHEAARLRTRRQFLRDGSLGLGAAALASLIGGGRGVAQPPAAPAVKAKRVIYLHMSGAPPQQELFDYKPKLVELHMKPCPDEWIKGQRFPFIKGHPKLLGSPYKFAQHGESGAWVSELLPHFGELVDEVAFVKSMWTDQFNHAPAELFLYTGSPRNGGAAMGSWTTYGLGSENQDLPGFVVLISGGTDPTGGKALWSTGYLPSVLQGAQCRSGGEPILYANNPPCMGRDTRRRSLDALKALTELELKGSADPETHNRVSQYEL